ncbi:hypothetical protein [Pseudoclavibacter soli]|uniref:hypothetical protein n=1 Tax=Pseudoclavibacter soli TaxID=452623 RepID=UPI0004154CAE|nr:hypothetical protein [Pseudoclavibacter soli]
MSDTAKTEPETIRLILHFESRTQPHRSTAVKLERTIRRIESARESTVRPATLSDAPETLILVLDLVCAPPTYTIDTLVAVLAVIRAELGDAVSAITPVENGD